MFIETKLDKGARAPFRAHLNDAGADLFSNETCTLAPDEQYMVDTGIAVKIPENYVGYIFNRSSRLLQAIGVIIKESYTLRTSTRLTGHKR